MKQSNYGSGGQQPTDSELTRYCNEELQSVERIVGQLRRQGAEGRCDRLMRGGLQHLADEMLFLRAVLTKHPPYNPVISRTNEV